MALDQNLTPSAPETPRASAIENELPAYRAITPFAVVSLLCGLISFFCFANWFFLVFAVAAVGLGIHADRKIKRDPEIWTGRPLAHFGMALGLMFGLSAVTISIVQDQLNRRAAAAFARQYVEVVKTRKVAEALYLQFGPAARATKSPDELYKEVASQADAHTMQSRYGAAQKMKDRLASGSGQEIHFERIEATGFEGITPVVTALLELHGPATKEFPEPEEHALLVLKGVVEKGKLQWWADEVMFPYKPKSFRPAEKPVDDGHGHAH